METVGSTGGWEDANDMRVKEQVYLLFCDFANCLSSCKNGFDNRKHDIFTYSSHGISGGELKSFMYDRSS